MSWIWKLFLQVGFRDVHCHNFCYMVEPWAKFILSLWGFSFKSPVIQQLCIIGLNGVYDFVVVNIMLIWNYCNYSDLGLHEVEIQKSTIIAFSECMKWLELLMVALEWYWSYWSYWRWHWSCWWLPWYIHLQANSKHHIICDFHLTASWVRISLWVQVKFFCIWKPKFPKAYMT